MFRHASKYMIAHGVSAALGFAAVAIFTRLLSPSEYGLYVIGMSLMGVINAILFAWVRISILRFQSEAGSDVRSTAMVGYGVSVLVAPVAVALALGIADMSAAIVVLSSLVALALGLFDFGQEIFRARQLPDAYMRVAILRSVVTLAASLVMVQLGLGGAGLLAGIGIAYFFAAIVSAPWIWNAPRRGFDRAMFGQMVAFGIPIAISGALFAFHSALDRFIIIHALGENDAGIYGASADLVRQIILFPALSIGSAIGPLAIRALAEGDRGQAEDQLQSGLVLLLSVVLPATVGLAIVAPNFAYVMLGPDFRAMAEALIPILVLAWLFQALTHQYVHLSFHLAKASKLILLQGGLMLVVNAAAMLVLVPRFGLIGAAWALVGTEFIGLVLGCFLSRRAFPLPMPSSSARAVVLATIAMALPTYCVAVLTAANPVLSLALTVAAGVVTYGAAALLFDVLGTRRYLAQRFAA